MATWEVKKEESGIRLVAFIKQKLGDKYSSRLLKKAIEHNLCKVNNKTEHFASTVLGTGDLVSFQSEKISTLHTSSSTSPLDVSRILYEDDDILAYDKPVGMTSDDPSLISFLLNRSKDIALIHRLDRDTTGVLLLAKTKTALEAMTILFRKRLVKKTYLAIVDGIPDKKSGSIDNTMGAIHRYQGQTLWGIVPKESGLQAVTMWKCEKSGKKASLIRAFPKTGRTHQIRVHLNSIGHPILGDTQYGKHFKCPYQPGRCLLHALEVSFPHPITQQILTIKSQLPSDFTTAITCVIGEFP